MIRKFTRGNGILEGFLSRKRAEKANEMIAQHLRKGRVLDIGCGSFPYFLNTTNFNQKYGIDPYLSTTNQKNMNLIKADISKKNFSFDKNFFDVVTMLAVFEHIDGDKLVPVLKEVLRILKKDGVFIITTPSPWSDKLLHKMANFNLISSEEINEHKSHYNRDDIIRIIHQAGFQAENIESGYFEFGFNMWFRTKK